MCSLTLQEFCVVDSTVHLGHFVFDGVSPCITHGTSIHFPLYSFHVTDSIYCVWEDVHYFEIPVYVLVMCHVSNPVSFFYGTTAPSGSGPPCYWGFTMTLRHTTLVTTPLDEWSGRGRDLYLKTHKTRGRYSCSGRDSYPQPQQESERRPTPYSAQPMGSALFRVVKLI